MFHLYLWFQIQGTFVSLFCSCFIRSLYFALLISVDLFCVLWPHLSPLPFPLSLPSVTSLLIWIFLVISTFFNHMIVRSKWGSKAISGIINRPHV